MSPFEWDQLMSLHRRAYDFIRAWDPDYLSARADWDAWVRKFAEQEHCPSLHVHKGTFFRTALAAFESRMPRELAFPLTVDLIP